MKYIIEIPAETYKKIRFYGKPLNQRDVEALEKALTQAEVCKTGKWIPVSERLPEHGQEVLCACRAGIYEVLKYVDGISGPWYKDSLHVYMKGFVTHWMPLPEPPKEEE